MVSKKKKGSANLTAEARLRCWQIETVAIPRAKVNAVAKHDWELVEPIAISHCCSRCDSGEKGHAVA